MALPPKPPLLWTAWLRVAVIAVMIFGLALLVAPNAARSGFSLLLYADPSHLSSFGEGAVAYISLVHAVLGSVMFGWALALLLVVHDFARGVPGSWRIVAASVAAWFIPDTAFSLWSGFWTNAVLNGVLMLLFAVPLGATYRVFRRGSA